MDTPNPVQGKPINKKARLLAFVIIFLIIIGVPGTMYFIHRNDPVDPNANKATIDYYKDGEKTSIPSTSPGFENLKSQALYMVDFATNFSNSAMGYSDEAIAKNKEAVELTFTNTHYANTNNINGSTGYKKLLIIPTNNSSTVHILFGDDTYTTKDAIFDGAFSESYFTDARSAAAISSAPALINDLTK